MSPSLHPAFSFQQDDLLLKQAAVLLHQQWPSGGSVSHYAAKTLTAAGVAESHPAHNRLPLSYLFVENFQNDENSNKPRKVIGHGRLTECCEMEGSGKAVAATYIIVDPARRGQGLGTQLMHALEDVARGLGYHYIYLWTTTAVPFYQQLGYRTTCRVSLNSACLKTLQSEQVGKLESMLALRHQGKPAETVMLPPGASPADKDVWLRKRLLESLSTFDSFGLNERLAELERYIRTRVNAQHHRQWKYILHADLPWQSQVGPSCGLTALRMLSKWCKQGTPSSQHDRLPCFLAEAQKMGFTEDGEMFDIRNLQSLATDFCYGLRSVELCDTEDLTVQRLADTLRNNSVAILSYDSQPSSKLPCEAGGLHAHYGVCVGILMSYEEDPSPAVMEEPYSLSAMETNDVGNPSSTLLLVQQSLSPKLVIASYDDFMASNNQLLEIDSTKFAEPQTMHLRGWSLICAR